MHVLSHPVDQSGPAANQMRTGGNFERRRRFKMENRLLGEGSSGCDGIESQFNVVQTRSACGDVHRLCAKSADVQEDAELMKQLQTQFPDRF